MKLKRTSNQSNPELYCTEKIKQKGFILGMF